MFWSIQEPIAATLALFTTFAIIAIFVIPIFAFLFKCRWWKLVLFTVLMAVLMLPPTSATLWQQIDARRFGRFNYHRFEDIKDQRVERYLPPKATSISLFKDLEGSGYVARYQISEADLLEYVDGLWEKNGQHSASERVALGGGHGMTSEPRFNLLSSLVGQLPTETPRKQFASPDEGDGGGARYYFFPETNEVFQFSSYW